MVHEKVYLMILDGFGQNPTKAGYAGNAIAKAKMPVINSLRKKYPTAILKAAGQAVGLPQGTQGGSEVGHFTMGMGRIIFQSLEEINRSIKDRSFFQKKPLLAAVAKVKKPNKGALHLLGMISDQGVHSHLEHLFALLEFAKKNKVGTVYIHAITDGRDVPEKSARKFIKKILAKITKLGMNKPLFPSGPKQAAIATIIGRYYAMDRDKNWDRTAKAYNLYTLGQGRKETDPMTAIAKAYKRGIKTDYYIDPLILNQHGIIKKKDAVIFWNYRTDRTKQLTQCFTGENKIGFLSKKTVRPFFVCLGDFSATAPVVFPTKKVINNLGSVIEQNSLRQLRIAETEKYAHVTYFFNSQRQTPFKGEKRILINSPKVRSYGQKPAMRAYEITNSALKEIAKNDYSLIVQNFANPDLVGHSGELQATIKACEVIDECIGKIVPKALQKGYHVIITADHGNAEYMIYKKNGEPCPSHTTNPVICMLISAKYKNAKLAKNRGLQDIAPTILDIMNLKKPKEMTGKSLIIRKL